MGMFGFLGNLFGGSGDVSEKNTANTAASIEYNGYVITPTPIKEGGQYRTAGTISKEENGTLRSSQFIRADNTTSEQGAIDHSIQKGKQIVDEQGAGLLDRPNL